VVHLVTCSTEAFVLEKVQVAQLFNLAIVHRMFSGRIGVSAIAWRLTAQVPPRDLKLPNVQHTGHHAILLCR